MSSDMSLFLTGVQKLNGVQGSLIVRQPKEEDPNRNLYDFDLPSHILLIMDWHHAEAETRTPGLIRRDVSQDTTFYLINGKGRYTVGMKMLLFSVSQLFGDSNVKMNYSFFLLLFSISTILYLDLSGILGWESHFSVT